MSPLFLHLNTSKRSITLDLDTEHDRDLLLRLLPRFDVLVENFAPGYLAARGLDRTALDERQPQLVIARITPFGQSGPSAGFLATDLTLQAASGMAHHNGDPGREPLRIHGPQAYYLAGVHAAVAILGALQRRRVTGEPQDVDVSVALCGANVIVPSATSFAYAGVETIRRTGGRGTFAVYPAADGAVTISVYHTGREWPDFVEMVDRPGLRDPKFATARGRNENIEELESEILAWTISKPRMELADLGRRHRIAVGMETAVEDLVASEQLASRGFFVRVDHPVAGEIVQTGAPVVMTASPWRMTRPASLAGEHTADVFQELGIEAIASALVREQP